MQAMIHGCRLHYEIKRNAKANAPHILLLHGWGCDSASFSFIENALLEGATIITLDFPGHGQSDEPPAPWGVDDYAKQVLELLQRENLMPVSIIAHSFGGRVAMVLAANHPEGLTKLVITGGAGIKPPVSERSRKRTKRFKRYNAILERLKAIRPITALINRMQASLRARYGSSDYVKLNETMRKTFVKIISKDLLPLLGSIQAPTLLIWGSADTETPLWMGQTMEQQIPDAGLVVFDGGSHYAFIEQWQRFSVIVKQFLLEGTP